MKKPSSTATSAAGKSPKRLRKREGKSLVPLPEMLRRKVRYFSDGAALDSAAFVEGMIEGLKARGRLGAERKSGANRLRGGSDWGELRVLRGLQVSVFGPPPG